MAEALQHLREDANLSKYALEKRMGKHENYVRRIESGERYIDFPSIVDWIKACDGDWLDFMRDLGVRLDAYYGSHGEPLK